MKLSALAVFSLTAVSSSSAFSPSSFNFGGGSTSVLHATATKGTVTAPSTASDDEAKNMYDEHVQTTYG